MSANISAGTRMHIGAEFVLNEGARFRVWAPDAAQIDLICENSTQIYPLKQEANGYFSAFIPNLGEGLLYKFRVNGGEQYPDPASRFQPAGPFGPSQLVNPNAYQWTDLDWKGVRLEGQIIYELHIGTFSPGGTWKSAIPYLKELKEIGITVLEVMPVADFPGEFNWGYDGVNLFAPTRLYGTPNDFKEFINSAHLLGLGVILDVVYNHFGPAGNFISKFSADYFTDKYENEWGSAINFDDKNSKEVREFFLANAEYWISEFHLDGLRLDATQQIFDSSTPNIMQEIGERCRKAAGSREVIVVCENESQETKLVRGKLEGGYCLDAIWNDDLHHSAFVALTGRNEAYYTDYLGTSQEFISAAKWGMLYQGQFYKWQKKNRGTPTFGLPSYSFVTFLENHDQVANSATGERLRSMTSPSKLKAMAAYMLLLPSTPMLFQGEEFGATTPFLYFADHSDDLPEKIREGRRKFLEQFASNRTEEIQNTFADPCNIETFQRSKLSDEERRKGSQVKQFYCDLLQMRKTDKTFCLQCSKNVDAAVISDQAFVIRYFGEASDDRLVVVNLGREIEYSPAPIPLLAPPLGKIWREKWSSEHPRYGGRGNPNPAAEGIWRFAGECTTVFEPAGERGEM